MNKFCLSEEISVESQQVADCECVGRHTRDLLDQCSASAARLSSKAALNVSDCGGRVSRDPVHHKDRGWQH